MATRRGISVGVRNDGKNFVVLVAQYNQPNGANAK